MRKNNSISVNSDLLRTFATVAETGNVSRAAQTLGRTQSAISLQVRKLEGRLSVGRLQPGF
jgi:DNA-binding transcriptional LysR family regulator